MSCSLSWSLVPPTTQTPTICQARSDTSLSSSRVHKAKSTALLSVMPVRALLLVVAAIVAALVWLPVATNSTVRQTTTTIRKTNGETQVRMEQDRYRRSVEELRQQMLGSFDKRKADATRAYTSGTATNYAVYRNGRRNQFQA